MGPRGTRIAGVRSTARVDRGNPRPDAVPFYERGVPHLHAGYIREGVVGADHARERDPEGSSSRLPGGRLEERCLRRHSMTPFSWSCYGWSEKGGYRSVTSVNAYATTR